MMRIYPKGIEEPSNHVIVYWIIFQKCIQVPTPKCLHFHHKHRKVQHKARMQLGRGSRLLPPQKIYVFNLTHPVTQILSISIYVYEFSTKIKKFQLESLLLVIIAKIYTLTLCLMHILYVKMKKGKNLCPLSSNSDRLTGDTQTFSFILLFTSVVPKLFGTRDQFRGRQFFHRPGWVVWGDGSGGNTNDGER